MINVADLLDKLWVDFKEINPDATKIHKHFTQKYGQFSNDHIAFRTFRHPKIGLGKFISYFEKLGYKVCDEYHFVQKKLYARHFEHPDKQLPKIFVSELLVSEFSSQLQEIVAQLVSQLQDDDINSPIFPVIGRKWDISFEQYQKLNEESEYAAWLGAHGLRVNHFTVLINSISEELKLEDVNQFVKGLGFKLNNSGGEIKGSSTELLEQSSTLAYKKDINFTDGVFEIPTCYYEFAKRYKDKTGRIYQGFIASSADKIFESTNQTTN